MMILILHLRALRKKQKAPKMEILILDLAEMMETDQINKMKQKIQYKAMLPVVVQTHKI